MTRFTTVVPALVLALSAGTMFAQQPPAQPPQPRNHRDRASGPESRRALSARPGFLRTRRRRERRSPRAVHAAEPGLSGDAAHLLGLRAGAVRQIGPGEPDDLQRRPGVQEHGGRPARPERARQPDRSPRAAGDAGGVHQPGPHAGTAGADAAGMGRPDDQPADRVQLARRQVRPRHRRRADAGALQGVQHLQGSRAPRHRRRQLRRDRGVHRRLGAAERFPQGPQPRSAASPTSAAATPTPTSSARARRSRSGSSCRTDATTIAASGEAAPTTRCATGSCRTCG